MKANPNDRVWRPWRPMVWLGILAIFWLAYEMYEVVDRHHALPFAVRHRMSKMKETPTIWSPGRVRAAAQRKLACFVAVGRPGSLPAVLHNIVHHFTEADGWDCRVFVWATTQELPDNEPMLRQIAARCTIERHSGWSWGDFLFAITPALIDEATYAYVALLLDDVWLPSAGATPVSVPRLVEHMEAHNLSVVSPAILGSHWEQIMPKWWPTNRCIVPVYHIEIFATLYSAATWKCMFRNVLERGNDGGWCYDLCLPKLCGGQHAVDYSMVAYHLEKMKRPTPEMLAEGIPRPAKRRKAIVQHTSAHGNNDLCLKHECPNPREFKVGTLTSNQKTASIPLECSFWA